MSKEEILYNNYKSAVLDSPLSFDEFLVLCHNDNLADESDKEVQSMLAETIKSMSEYAQQDSIAFKEWCDKNAWYYDNLEQQTHTTEQLYKIYKSQP